MRGHRLRLHLTLICLIAFAVLLVPTARAAQTIDRVVAVVNNGIILQSELDNAMNQIEAQLRSEGRQLPPKGILEKQVLEHLVMQKIQIQEAHKHNIQISDKDINNAIQSIAQNNGLTAQQFQSALQAQGLDPHEFRQEVRDQLMIKRLQKQEIQTNVSVTPRDVDLYLQNQSHHADSHDAYHLLHILLAVPENASQAKIAQIKARAQQLVHKLRNGADFQSVAMRVSDGQHALKGGDLGWIKAGALPTLFAKVVPNMKPGDVSSPLRSPSGFHIVKLAGERNSAQSVTEVHVRHILLRPNPQRGNAQTHQLAEKLYQQLKNGASFSELARVYSDDPQSAKQGGDLGWQPLGSYVQSFQQAIENLHKGQISQPFKTPFGWHIAQLLGRRQKQMSDKMRRQQARQAIGERKAREQYQNWLRRLRAEAYVKYLIPVGKKGGNATS